jgi:hypothetical protein
MGLRLAQKQAVSVAIATRYKCSGKAAKGRMLDELCATTGCRNHARKALRLAGAENRPAEGAAGVVVWTGSH